MSTRKEVGNNSDDDEREIERTPVRYEAIVILTKKIR